MTRTHRSLAIALAVLALTTPTAALADGARPAPLGESLTGEAKADYDSGRILFEDGDFAGAASKFRQAYDRAKDPRLLWNVAVCEKGLRHYVRVYRLTQRYLDEGKAMLAPEQEKAARELRDATKAFIGTARVEAPAGAEISVDGEPIGTAPLAEPVPLDLGPHKISVQKPGMQAWVSSFEVAGGVESTLVASLKPLDRRARISVHAGEGDTITFDGMIMGTTRWQAEVDAGTHALRVTAPRRKPYDVRLDLAEGGSRTVDVTLESEGRPLWQWIAGGVVLAGAATFAGWLIFKPDDKQAEQPPGNLAPGTVNLSFWGLR